MFTRNNSPDNSGSLLQLKARFSWLLGATLEATKRHRKAAYQQTNYSE